MEMHGHIVACTNTVIPRLDRGIYYLLSLLDLRVQTGDDTIGF